MSNQNHDSTPWSSVLLFVFLLLIPIVGIAQCSGAMPPSPEQRCEEKGGVWEYKLHDCMNPDVYMK